MSKLKSLGLILLCLMGGMIGGLLIDKALPKSVKYTPAAWTGQDGKGRVIRLYTEKNKCVGDGRYADILFADNTFVPACWRLMPDSVSVSVAGLDGTIFVVPIAAFEKSLTNTGV